MKCHELRDLYVSIIGGDETSMTVVNSFDPLHNIAMK
jgi:hypothetical protein